MHYYHILLGGNIGDTAKIFKQSLQYISIIGTVVKTSSLHRSPPWGKTHQRYYFNQMIVVRTHLGPFALLRKLKRIEKLFHRSGKGLMLPRKLDLDIIFFEDNIIRSQNLTIPHPLMHLREFVLIPLQETSPSFLHPILLKSPQGFLDDIKLL